VRIYDITPSKKTVILEKKPFTVPSDYKGVVPMYANETIDYSIKEIIHG
ncbi:MAG TPA: dihydroorotase, partial [Epsilonproteobacteria bacterium]|nr:dihydroorotase [Campylobacterota bacterium]